MGEDGVVVECDGAGCVPMRAGSEMRFFRPWAPNAPSMTLEAPYRQPIVQKGGIVNCCVDGFVTVGEWPGSGLQNVVKFKLGSGALEARERGA